MYCFFALALSKFSHSFSCCAAVTVRGFLYGFLPIRKGYKAQLSAGHNSTSFVWPCTQSMHFSLIALIGFVFFKLSSICHFGCPRMGHVSGLSCPRMGHVVLPSKDSMPQNGATSEFYYRFFLAPKLGRYNIYSHGRH